MDWEMFHRYATQKTMDAFTDQHPTAMGMEDEIAHLAQDYRAIPANQYQATVRQMEDAATTPVQLREEDASPWHLPVAATFPATATTPTNIPAPHNVSMTQYEEIAAVITYDISNELEKATSVTFSLTELHQERTALDQVKHAANDTGDLYRLGHVPARIFPDMDGFYSHGQFENGNLSLSTVYPYMTRKRRYIDHVKSHGPQVLCVGGTDSIQLTMRPRIENGVDTMFTQFYTGKHGLGIPAFSPVLYAPFMNSPVIRNGALETHMARDAEYRQALASSPYVDTDGTRKWGYIPETAEIDGVADMVELFAGKRMQFSAGISADALQVIGGNGAETRSFYELYGDRFEAVTPDTEVHVRVGTEKPVTFKEFVQQEALTGIVTLPASGDEIGEEVVVRIDYTDLDDDAFKDVAWQHFVAHSTGVWPNYRPRFEGGAIESRDYGNSPRIQEAIDTQAAVFLNWRELQSFAAEHFTLSNTDAEELRNGVVENGLQYELPSGYTVKQVWIGDGLDTSLLDILAEGVFEASYGLPRTGNNTAERRKYAERYRERMETYLENGTYSHVFAKNVENKGREAAIEATRVKPET